MKSRSSFLTVVVLALLAATTLRGSISAADTSDASRARLRQQMDDTAELLKIEGVPVTSANCQFAVDRLQEAHASWEDLLESQPEMEADRRERILESDALTRVYLRSFQLYCQSLAAEARAAASPDGTSVELTLLCTNRSVAVEQIADEYLRFELSQGQVISREEWDGPAYLQYALIKAYLRAVCE